MAIIPLSLQHELENIIRLPIHSFGMEMKPWDFYSPLGLSSLGSNGECKHCGNLSKKDGAFKVNINVKEFTPEELKITTEGNMILVEGKHEEKVDGDGLVWRHFVRKYLIPDGHHIEGAVSQLSKQGILTITAPKKGDLIPGPTTIPITHASQENGKELK